MHLRLPTSFCSPNFAYLMASDAKDALRGAGLDAARCVVELDDHHDSRQDQRRAGGRRRLPRHVRPRGRGEPRRAARDVPAQGAHRGDGAVPHGAASGRSGPRGDRHSVTCDSRDLPDGDAKAALLRRRCASDCRTPADALVMVDHDGDAATPPRRCRWRCARARSTRISIDGNAHFCRGLLATRYADDEPPPTSHCPPTRRKEPT